MTTPRTPDVEDVLELTPVQHGLLVHCLRAPNAGFYLEQMTFTLRGALDAGVVRRAWEVIVARHPGLRTSFSWEDINRPVQVVHRSAALPLDEIDLRHLDPCAQEDALAAHLLDERRRGFDLESAPLLRLTVFRTRDREYRLAWRFSHLVMDGWSFGLIMGDFVELYKALHHGHEPVLGPARSPRGYVRWWREQDPERLRGFWTDHLAGYESPPPLDTGEDPDAGGDTVRHGYVESILGPLAPRVEEVGRARGLTLNTLVQGAWTLVLARSYRADDIVVGATMSHRPAEVDGCESVVGPLIVTLPVRARLDPAMPAAVWLADLQGRILAAREHAGATLPDIRGWSGVRSPDVLFETIVSYENVPIPDISFAEEGLELAGYQVDGRPQYPMSLIALPGRDLPLRVIFDRTRFGEPGARRMLDRLVTALRALVDNPDAPLGEIDVIGVDERARVLELAGPVREVAAGSSSITAAVRAIAEADPDRVAVAGPGGELTYGALVDLAGRVGAALRAVDVRPGDRVLVAARRGVRLPAAALGVLWAGAAYVPLDPDHPAARHRAVAEAAGAVAVVAEDGIGGDVGLPAVDLTAVLPDPAPPAPDDPEAVAYVLHTSGSTGAPKGVAVTHRNVLRLVACAEERLDLSGADVWSQFFSPAFDGAAWETWGALITGSRLVVVPADTARDPEELRALLAREQVSVCTLSPSALAQLPVEGPRLALRTVVLGGEKVEPAALAPWLTAEVDVAVVNAYGPTEATVWVCSHRLDLAETVAARPRSRIGVPLPDTAVVLTDLSGLPAPLGAPGEMWLCGPGVALGYTEGDPERRFGTAPLPELAHLRAYRSGDLARWTQDGELEFLGRADDQVKVRGHRVELGEVEHHLAAVPGVRAAVAAVRDPGTGGVLAAYVVPEAGADRGALPAAVRAHCAAALPDYLVPGTVITLDRLPLRGNGKVDRAALPAPGGPAGSAMAPRTPTEAHLAALLSELLAVPEIGVEDDLQDLGLHSLIATRVVSAVRSRWRVSLPLRTLFESPTVASLAALVDGGGVPATGPDRPGAPDLAREARLAPTLIAARGRRWPEDPASVLVTGATGFPGARLVAETLRRTDAHVHCLVRAQDDDQALRRLEEHLRGLGWWEDGFAGRVHGLAGDLARPALGLGEERFAAISEVDEIYHFGAQVNFLHPYRRLRASNVAGTAEVIRLAMTGRASVLHHVSGVGVFPARAAAEGLYRGVEVDLDPAAPMLPNGYTETKWVAERLAAQARDRGLPVVVHRLGRVSGDSRTGAWKAGHDALAELLRASVALEALPAFDGVLDMVPVDYVGTAMAAIARRPDAHGRVFHLVNPSPLVLDDLIAGFALAGRSTETLPMTRWYARLLEMAADDRRTDWSVATALMSEWTQHASHRMRDPRFESGRTREFLGDDVRCPLVDAEVLARYLDHLRRIGFLVEPRQTATEEGAQAWPTTPVAGS
ncbi:amino acid adenylation domain-containing protein [Actinokineospora guangxiensis]|uniref:Amino acid adenylation domain-containing protein n=1 Tax=Actinokineospora guangxiensis TaxID=1490288 RepID=A0ABW0ERQ1_9PSEU